MPLQLVNPMNEFANAPAPPAPRLASLEGRNVALLDISKPGGSIFLDRLEHLLRTRYGVATVSRAMKPTFAKPAPPDIIAQLRGADAVIESLAD